MNVKEFSAAVGISAHTIRYYDKVGLLGDVRRLPNGHRDFGQKEVDWIQFVQRLKDTGMPIAEMLVYAKLRAAGDSTLEARQQLLQRHLKALDERIARDRGHRENLARKIAWYEARTSLPEKLT